MSARPNGHSHEPEHFREPMIPPVPPVSIERLLSIEEAAELMGTTVQLIKTKTRNNCKGFTNNNPIPYIRVGREKKFRASELREWQDRNHSQKG